MKILVLHGPNLNLLGTREPETYGSMTLDEINNLITAETAGVGAELEFFQSNHEGALVDRIQEASGRVDGLLINAGGYTHTSVALRDAISAAGLPAVEVHISNINAREPFRRRSMLSDVVIGSVVGLGPFGYALGARGLIEHLKS